MMIQILSANSEKKYMFGNIYADGVTLAADGTPANADRLFIVNFGTFVPGKTFIIRGQIYIEPSV